MIGTVNNSAGILADSTGNRRFWVATIQEIDWNYTNLDPNQVWAEAFTAYTNGETWYLTPDERAKSEENNDQYRVPNIIEGYLHKYFYIEPQNHNKWTATNEIVARLIDMGYKGSSSRSVAMEVAGTLKELGLEKKHGSACHPVAIPPGATWASGPSWGCRERAVPTCADLCRPLCQPFLAN